MRKIFSFFNQKGGVGKTTSVINIAATLACKGKKILIVDLDSQGNSTSGLGLDKNKNEFTAYQLLVENLDPFVSVKPTSIDNLFVIPSNADLAGAEIQLINIENREYVLKGQLEKIAEKYDYVFLDCPPSLGLISINALTASDYIIIPLQCEYYALEGLGSLLSTYQLVRKSLNPSLELGGVILTMASFQTNLTKQVIDEVRGYFKEKVFTAVIPRSVKLSEAPSFGKPAVIYDPQSRGSLAYVELSHEFLTWFVSDNDRTQEETQTGDLRTEALAEEKPRVENGEQSQTIQQQ